LNGKINVLYLPGLPDVNLFPVKSDHETFEHKVDTIVSTTATTFATFNTAVSACNAELTHLISEK
jgi:hypothetical protein